jgi:catechol 2,3-dioxygenase-like lactoylglutathione lyase family enzyme
MRLCIFQEVINLISGISHITFIVKNLDKATIFFKDIFGAKEIYDSGDKKFSISKEKYFLVNNIWIAVMEGEKIEKSYNHIAFKIDESDYEMYLERIKNLGLEIKRERRRVTGEGNSIYFYDYDNHLFELHTGTLETRLLCYKEEQAD